uniref:3-oxo-5-alpha-steroid 4-dehydrogenase C-terminal domain-containing protein n=1 Tax=Euplotes crassus TaxID=5936 RepID=A0A7S3KSZ5_EUPCR|mmetsp:Transcript_4790/g.4524  ORF Transcript_4790/g.4524 Transcript_4790/m.4524 type:complete len:200 (+) Transcript_4790:240-839(+)
MNDRVNVIVAILIIFCNYLYLYPGYQIITRQVEQESHKERLAASLIMFVFGIFLTLTSNCQKYFTLQAIKAQNPHKKFLIKEGMFKWTRNPNYLGEILTFFSFCNLYSNWDSWILYSILLFSSMYPMMLQKDESLKTKEGAEEYLKSSGFLLPKFTTCWLVLFMTYINIIMFLLCLNLSGGVEKMAKNAIYMIKTCGIM